MLVLGLFYKENLWKVFDTYLTVLLPFCNISAPRVRLFSCQAHSGGTLETASIVGYRMASITKRETKAGIVWKAEIRKGGGGKAFRESKTFPKRAMALKWASRRESELSDPAALLAAQRTSVTIKDLIELYEAQFNDKDQWGRTKTHDLTRIKGYDIASLSTDKITSADIVQHVIWRRKTCGPSTANNDIIWLRVVFKMAGPAFGISANVQAVSEAALLCDSQSLTARSGQRTRRPTIEELELILDYEAGAPRSKVPMTDCILFLLFSARRDGEMCRIRWSDLDSKNKRVLVRDMKHPSKKAGNHVEVQVTDDAWKIIQRQPRVGERIFPFNPDSISTRFTKTCKILGIEGLRLHDLRHECASWLGELGVQIPFIAKITGHRNWNMLQRYTHVEEHGDKYEGWKWRP